MNILVVGDSWACGAYTNEKESDSDSANFTHEPIQVLKPLLESDGHIVTIDCYSGQSDTPSLRSAQRHASKMDIIIFYKTGTDRAIGLQEVNKHNGIKNAFVEFDKYLYSELESLPTRVFLIGGLDKVPIDTNADFIIPSLPELLLNTSLPIYCGGRDFFDDVMNWYNYGHIGIDDLEYANELMMDSIKLHKLFASNPTYFPDLGHPGEKSTKILYELIKDKL